MLNRHTGEFEGIAKTNTTHAQKWECMRNIMFEGIAKTNTTHAAAYRYDTAKRFEGIAKTNTTHAISSVLVERT